MKKITILCLIIIMPVLLIACNREQVDFRSVRETSSNTVLSLGDPKSAFDDALGEGVFDALLTATWQETHEDAKAYNYIHTGFTVVFYHDVAMNFSLWIAGEMRERNTFEFYQMSYDMTDDEVNWHFIRPTFLHPNYYRYFDSEGQDVPYEQAEYFARLIRGPGVGNLNLMIGVFGWEGWGN